MHWLDDWVFLQLDPKPMTFIPIAITGHHQVDFSSYLRQSGSHRLPCCCWSYHQQLFQRPEGIALDFQTQEMLTDCLWKMLSIPNKAVFWAEALDAAWSPRTVGRFSDLAKCNRELPKGGLSARWRIPFKKGLIECKNELMNNWNFEKFHRLLTSMAMAQYRVSNAKTWEGLHEA